MNPLNNARFVTSENVFVLPPSQQIRIDPPLHDFRQKAIQESNILLPQSLIKTFLEMGQLIYPPYFAYEEIKVEKQFNDLSKVIDYDNVGSQKESYVFSEPYPITVSRNSLFISPFPPVWLSLIFGLKSLSFTFKSISIRISSYVQSTE